MVECWSLEYRWKWCAPFLGLASQTSHRVPWTPLLITGWIHRMKWKILKPKGVAGWKEPWPWMTVQGAAPDLSPHPALDCDASEKQSSVVLWQLPFVVRYSNCSIWLIHYCGWWDAQKKTSLRCILLRFHPLSCWVMEGYRTTLEFLESGWVRGLHPIVWASEDKDNGYSVILITQISTCKVLCNCKKSFLNTWFHVIKLNIDKNPHFTDEEAEVQV